VSRLIENDATPQVSFPACDIAGLLVAGMTPREVRAVTTSGVSSLVEYSRLSAEELTELGLKHVVAVPFAHDEIWVAKAGEPGYPRELSAISAPPLVLFGRGDRDAVRSGVAVIGTREMSRIGENVAKAAVAGAALAGVPVISGLAKGCDTAGHRAALDAGAITVAVVAGGVDVVYPAENAELLGEILANGGAVVSEQPPGVEVAAHRLQARNRILTGLSYVVVPCEAGRRSRGTLGAVGTALEAGRMLVVGRVKPTWRHFDGAWMAERLALGNHIDAKAFGWSQTAAERAAKCQGAIANGVGDDRESIIELVQFGVMWARTEPATASQPGSD
jgi:DNA protecting protein DprA